MKNRLLPPRYFNTFLLLAIALHFVFPIRTMIDAPYTGLGLVFILLGLGLNIWSVRCLNEEKTTIDFHGTPQRLVVTGPFRISRNPIYLSGVILSLGVAILLGSLISFSFPLMLLLILDRLYIPSEERKLQETFGRDYLDYKHKVRRWI